MTIHKDHHRIFLTEIMQPFQSLVMKYSKQVMLQIRSF